MIIIKINFLKIFNECMDQTLIENRGGDIALCIDSSDIDICTRWLLSVSLEVEDAMRCKLLDVSKTTAGIEYQLDDFKDKPDSIGLIINDTLKYGVLCNWYKSRATPSLHENCAKEYEKARYKLNYKAVEACTTRQYRLY